MKEFDISGIHFWCGTAIEDYKIDISENAVLKLSEKIMIDNIQKEQKKMHIRCYMMMFVFKRIACNNWRKQHGFPMRRRGTH